MTQSDIHPDKRDTSIILAQLREIASAVTSAAEAGNLETVLERIAQVSRQLVKARYAALGVPDGKGGLLHFKVSGLTAEEHANLRHLPHGRGLIGALMSERKTIRLEKMQSDPRSSGFCDTHPLMTTFLGVPIQIGQQLFGQLYLCDRQDGLPFDVLDEWLIETIAGYAAVAISSSQLNDQQRRLAMLEERERIGMELHDGVIQSLYAIGMHLDLLRFAGGATETELSDTTRSLNAVIEDIRRYIMNLRGANRHSQTVRDGLEELLSRLHTPISLTITLDAPDDRPPFTPATFEAVCQMANEALSNAVRHADARQIKISAREEKHQFQIRVEDDGKGFDPTLIERESGLGLKNLQQRAILHGGRVTIESEIGKGTRVTIGIPIRAT